MVCSSCKSQLAGIMLPICLTNAQVNQVVDVDILHSMLRPFSCSNLGLRCRCDPGHSYDRCQCGVSYLCHLSRHVLLTFIALSVVYIRELSCSGQFRYVATW